MGREVKEGETHKNIPKSRAGNPQLQERMQKRERIQKREEITQKKGKGAKKWGKGPREGKTQNRQSRIGGKDPKQGE